MIKKKKLKIYLLSQSQNTGYDTYDSIVVCAEDEKDAKTIGPMGDYFAPDMQWCWAKTLDDIKCEKIGNALSTQKRGVILASFNAG